MNFYKVGILFNKGPIAERALNMIVVRPVRGKLVNLAEDCREFVKEAVRFDARDIDGVCRCWTIHIDGGMSRYRSELSDIEDCRKHYFALEGHFGSLITSLDLVEFVVEEAAVIVPTDGGIELESERSHLWHPDIPSLVGVGAAAVDTCTCSQRKHGLVQRVVRGLGIHSDRENAQFPWYCSIEANPFLLDIWNCIAPTRKWGSEVDYRRH
jgi:hypothetical protein